METVHVAKLKSEFGVFRLASTKVGLAYVELPREDGRGMRGWIEQNLPDARCVDEIGPNREAIVQIREYLQSARMDFDLALDLRGTPFQREVWAALLDIPYGETRSYVEVGRAVGRPRASRAVGGANNANPIALVVPCHRVIAADGSLGGYGGGLELKARLLAMERSHPSLGQLL